MGGYLILYTKKQLVPRFFDSKYRKRRQKGWVSYVLSKKTVSTAKGVGVSSEKYPKLHLVDVMSDTWYPIPPALCSLKSIEVSLI